MALPVGGVGTVHEAETEGKPLATLEYCSNSTLNWQI